MAESQFRHRCNADRKRTDEIPIEVDIIVMRIHGGQIRRRDVLLCIAAQIEIPVQAVVHRVGELQHTWSVNEAEISVITWRSRLPVCLHTDQY